MGCHPSHWRSPSLFKMGTLHHQPDDIITHWYPSLVVNMRNAGMYCPHTRNTNGFTWATALPWWSPFGTGWSTGKHRDPMGPDGTHDCFPFPSGKHTKNYGKTPCYEWENSRNFYGDFPYVSHYQRVYIYMFHIDAHTTSGFFTRFHQHQGLTHRQKTIELSHSTQRASSRQLSAFCGISLVGGDWNHGILWLSIYWE